MHMAGARSEGSSAIRQAPRRHANGGSRNTRGARQHALQPRNGALRIGYVAIETLEGRGDVVGQATRHVSA
jgi:hypothetical protein